MNGVRYQGGPITTRCEGPDGGPARRADEVSILAREMMVQINEVVRQPVVFDHLDLAITPLDIKHTVLAAG